MFNFFRSLIALPARLARVEAELTDMKLDNDHDITLLENTLEDQSEKLHDLDDKVEDAHLEDAHFERLEVRLDLLDEQIEELNDDKVDDVLYDKLKTEVARLDRRVKDMEEEIEENSVEQLDLACKLFEQRVEKRLDLLETRIADLLIVEQRLRNLEGALQARGDRQ